MQNPDAVLKIANGAHNHHTIRRKRMFTIWWIRMSACAMHCTTKELYAKMGFQAVDKLYEYLCTDFSKLKI